MTQTTTPPAPEVPLPPGTHVISDWADWDCQYRLIWGERRDIADISISVQPCASQLPNGTIDDHGEPPAICSMRSKSPSSPAAACTATTSRSARTGHAVSHTRCLRRLTRSTGG
jgi:hypothetical protein